MSLKNAAFLALIGTLLLTLLLGWDFLRNAMNVMNGLVPAVNVLTSLVYVFASLTVTLFFFVFYRGQG